MRTLLLGLLAFSSAALWAADPAQPAAAPATAPAAPEAPPPPKLTAEQERQVFVAQGFMLAHNMRLTAMAQEQGMSADEVAALIQGIELALKGGELPFDFQAIVPGARVFLGERAAAAAKVRDAANKVWTEQNAAFLAKVDADPAVTKTASGLRYQIVAAGSAEKPAATNTVKVRYTGRLCDGSVFDSTDENGGQPIEFVLSGVVKGWTEGLQLVGKGGKIHLWLPADLGYGAQAGGPIPAGSVLDFEVELIDFK